MRNTTNFYKQFYRPTERLRLTNFKFKDAQEFYRITQDSAIVKYMPYVYEYNVKGIRKTIKETYVKADFVRDYYIKIVEKKTKQMVGAIIAITNHEGKLELSVMIGEDYRKKGYMYEALREFYCALKERRIKEVVVMIHKDNKASNQLFEKLGVVFVKECGSFNKFIWNI